MTQKELTSFEKSPQFQKYIIAAYHEVHNHLLDTLNDRDQAERLNYNVAIFYGAQMAAIDAGILCLTDSASNMVNWPGYDSAKNEIKEQLPKLFQRQIDVLNELVYVSSNNCLGPKILYGSAIVRGYLMSTLWEVTRSCPALALADYAKTQVLQQQRIEHLHLIHPDISCFQK